MNTERCCIIFAGSPEEGAPCLPLPEEAYILCADSGLRRCERLGRKPDLVLGDFDSLGEIPEQLPIFQAPVEKDDTDTMLAVRKALEKGFQDIRICGAFGGRLDHTIANIQTLEFLHHAGARGILIGADDWMTLQPCGETRRYPKQTGFTFSLFSLTERVTGLKISGTHYDTENITLTRDFPRGVSNEITAEYAEISCESGLLLAAGSRLR